MSASAAHLRSLESASVPALARMSDDAVEMVFRHARWPKNNGHPSCPKCECSDHYTIEKRNAFRCKSCGHQYSVTSGTIFSSRKLSKQDMLCALAMYADASKGMASTQLSRSLGVQQKTAFVFCHKLREAITRSLEGLTLQGVVEIDGCTIGGHRMVENTVRDGFKRRIYAKKFKDRRVVTVMRQRFGRTVCFVGKRESDALPKIKQTLSEGTVIQADQAHAWDGLMRLFDMMRINHKYSFAANGACTNQAESFWSLLRKMHGGTHHKISGDFLHLYANELCWRQDFRELARGELIMMLLSLALNSPVSDRWTGYFRPRQLESDVAVAALGFGG